ncbi:hypothetical protein [Bradyrhizobium shewense]|uniref:hypothetical protein n=1 Tax=Bradyrhizobium shewense TaxID=1761772 RepID=UPI00101AEB4D|nr:hypothetical protein [Bradyrhizobium shewense]
MRFLVRSARLFGDICLRSIQKRKLNMSHEEQQTDCNFVSAYITQESPFRAEFYLVGPCCAGVLSDSMSCFEFGMSTTIGNPAEIRALRAKAFFDGLAIKTGQACFKHAAEPVAVRTNGGKLFH